jgi:CheY-like chemotaxis protein
MTMDEPRGRSSSSDALRSYALELPDPVRILVADDDAEMRELMASMLARAGYEVVQFRDGHQARHYVQGLANGLIRVMPEVIVTDHRMPGCSGLEVLETLRGYGLFVPAILISGFADPWLHERIERLGSAICLDKPFGLDRLRAEVFRLAPLVS